MPGSSDFSSSSPDRPLIFSQPTLSSFVSQATGSLTSQAPLWSWPPVASSLAPTDVYSSVISTTGDALPPLAGLPKAVYSTASIPGGPFPPPEPSNPPKAPFPLVYTLAGGTSPFEQLSTAVPSTVLMMSASTEAPSSSTSRFLTTTSKEAPLSSQPQTAKGLVSGFSPTASPSSQSLISNLPINFGQRPSILPFTTSQNPRAANVNEELLASSRGDNSTSNSTWLASSRTMVATSSFSVTPSSQSSPSVASKAFPNGYVTGVRLARPTPIFSQAVNDSHYDDVSATVDAGFAVQLFEQRSTSFTVSTNGLFVVGTAAVADDAGSSKLYAPGLPPGTACVFWKDLVAGNTAQQGIYYQLDDYGSNVQLSVEYILTDYVDEGVTGTDIYHVILQYDLDAVGLMELYYFSPGDGGALGTIGIQGFDAHHGMQAVTWDYNSPNSVTAGLKLNFVTNLNDDPNGTVAQRTFVTNCFPPGTWPIGVCRS